MKALFAVHDDAVAVRVLAGEHGNTGGTQFGVVAMPVRIATSKFSLVAGMTASVSAR